MSEAEWTDTYGIHHWRILRSIYRKLTWVVFEPNSHWIPFRRQNQLRYQMSSTRTHSQLCTATPISSFCSVFTFSFRQLTLSVNSFTKGLYSTDSVKYLGLKLIVKKYWKSYINTFVAKLNGACHAMPCTTTWGL